MTDIVEWLYGIHKSRQRLLETEDFECSFKRAADEIKRLRKTINDQAAEIERLQARKRLRALK